MGWDGTLLGIAGRSNFGIELGGLARGKLYYAAFNRPLRLSHKYIFSRESPGAQTTGPSIQLYALRCVALESRSSCALSVGREMSCACYGVELKKHLVNIFFLRERDSNLVCSQTHCGQVVIVNEKYLRFKTQGVSSHGGTSFASDFSS